MNCTGIALAVITFAIIGLFHPLVIWAEYHYSKRVWPLFAIAGSVPLAYSLQAESDFVSCVLAVLAACCFWSIRELYQQEERVKKGWFPKKPE
ncbi:MAG: DUF4491 family protein [bacterium]|nr:DUF4491 family protein [bacterium]